MVKAKAFGREADASGYTVTPGLRPNPHQTTRAFALRTVTDGRRVVYAMRVPDGAIKIGTTVDLANRLSALHAELLGFMYGDHDDESNLHRQLRAARVRGREYFRPTEDVLAVVNGMRDQFNLPHIAA